MKNVIMLVLDSFSFFEYDYSTENTPFLHSLENKSIFATNLFSQGPHTEVGSRGLICGCNTLDFGGSSRFFSKTKNTVFDIFLKEKYDVNYIGHPAIYVSKELRHHYNFHQYYTVIYKFINLWASRLEYWARINANRELNKRERDLAIGLCQDTFDVLYDFWLDVSEKKESIYFLEKQLENVDAGRILKAIIKEKNRFENNSWEYVKNLLKDFNSNILVPLTNINDLKAIDTNFTNLIQDKYKSILKELEKKQIGNNIWLDKFTFIDLMLAIKNKFMGKKEPIEIISEYFRRIDLAKEFEFKYQERSHFYFPPSIKRQLSFVLDILNKNEERGNKPSFIYLQPEELHYYHNWFSYDIIDENNINKEFYAIKKLLKNEKKLFNKKGYLTQTLALNYIDRCIKDFFLALKQKDLLDNTVILITADHGSSYGHAPIRNALPFNNFYSENYHIPLFLYNNGKVKKLENYLLSYDIVPLLLENLDIDKEKYFDNKIVNSDQGRKIIHSEYMGPGYQDLLGKEIWFSARNDNYKINYIVSLLGEFKDGRIEGIYNIKKDPFEHNNLVDQLKNNRDIEELLDYLKKRWNEIRKQQNVF